MNSYYPKDLKKDIQKLSNDICREYEDVELIYGISRGGLTAATCLSYSLNVPLRVIFPNEYNGMNDYIDSLYQNKKILLVDDMVDSGDVLRKVLNCPSDWIKTNRIHPKVAVLIYNIAQNIVPDFFGRTIDRNKDKTYINYFWEKIELCQ